MFMKFGQREHLEVFRSEGLLYAKHLHDFSKSENKADKVRPDRFEGADEIYQPSFIKSFTIKKAPDTKIVLGPRNFAGPVAVCFGRNTNCNVYCMYSMMPPLMNGSVDPRNFGFGDSFVIVLDTQEFCDRVAAAASARGLGSEARPVRYYDGDSYSGETGPFSKPDRFEFQREFRFAFWPGTKEPLHLKVGDLADITTSVHDLTRINELICFDEHSVRNAGSDVKTSGQPA